MELHFLGTRGYIDIRSRRHKLHASLVVVYRGKKLMIDCGEDWRKRVRKIMPDAIVITHGHPDHAWGLSEGSPAPVYASEETWRLIDAYLIEERHAIRPRKPQKIFGLRVPFRSDFST